MTYAWDKGGAVLFRRGAVLYQYIIAVLFPPPRGGGGGVEVFRYIIQLWWRSG